MSAVVKDDERTDQEPGGRDPEHKGKRERDAEREVDRDHQRQIRDHGGCKVEQAPTEPRLSVGVENLPPGCVGIGHRRHCAQPATTRTAPPAPER